MNVLFVCMGNLCRSPLAQGIFEHQLRERNLASQIGVDSCGTASFAVGKAPDPRAIEAGLRAGYDIRNQVARIFTAKDFERFSFILPMDYINLMNVKAWLPDGYQGELQLLRTYSQRGGSMEIADPYHKDAEKFDALIPELERATQGLLDYIERTALKSNGTT